MGRGNRSKESLNSYARLSFIDVFVPQTVSFEKSDNCNQIATFTPYRYRDLSAQLSEIEDSIIRKFPIIIKGNGEPWDLGNLYLFWKFSEAAKYDRPNIDTLTSIAKHLTAYLRWIEHNQDNGNTLHELYFPDLVHDRVTYRYHRYLRRLLKESPQPIKLGVAKARMNVVINFYKGLVKGVIVAEKNIKNTPYESRIKGIPVISSEGLQYLLKIETTDLSIKKPKREISHVLLIDGGALRPLSMEEQLIINDALWNYNNRELQLMYWLAIFTGARKQTIGTIRIKHIQELFYNFKKDSQELLLPVGQGTSIDLKQQGHGKKYRLHIPLPLAQLLYEYAESPRAKSLRGKSFYGDTNENYLFLTNNGTPFYTSQAEIIDRQDPSFSHRISLKNRVNFPISKGQAITNHNNRLLSLIKQKHPDFQHFRFHDLRATFGMNFVRISINQGIKPDLILLMLKARMGHSNIQTTMNYLNYDDRIEQINNYTAEHFDWLIALTNPKGSSHV